MLSIKPVKSAAGASHYYSAQDNYYLSDQGELEHATAWYGKGAATLGLSGQVNTLLFLQLLEGRLPSSEQLGMRGQNGEIHHRPGTDITLSAPKSVSVLALVGGDKRLLDVHNSAVRETFDAIEKMAAEARVTFNGVTSFEKTNNLTIALFQHTTSRELDANLHDHGVIMNMTKRNDGLWRALSSRSKQDKAHLDNGFREILYQNQHYFGLIYNSVLAKGTCDLGYDISVVDQYGNFEIIGVPESYLEHTSKRRNQIVNSMNAKGLTSAKAAEKANLDTRKSKDVVDIETLERYWKEDAEKQGVDFESLIEASKQRGKGSITTLEPIQVSETAREAVNDALEQLSPFRTQIKHGDLVRMAFMFARGTIHHDELEQDISERFNDKRLEGVASSYYTTSALVSQEKSFIQQIKASKGAGISTDYHGTGVASDILRSNDRVQLIDVKGLSHEKELIESLVHSSEASGLGAYVLHVGRMQANYLSDVVSRDTSSVWKWIKNVFKGDLVQTVAGFQARYEGSFHHPSKKQDVVIVHDAQKLSYQDLMSLDTMLEKSQSKLILLNNIRSTEGFHAGSPIKALKDAGFIAVSSTTTEKRATFEVVQTKKAHQDLAIYFAKLSNEERQTTKIVALTNKDVDNLTDLIRAQLKSAGIISLQSKDARVLSTQILSDVQKRNPKFYEKGDQVTFNAYTREQSHYRVVGKTNEAIELQDKEGNRQILKCDESTAFAVTKTKSLAFSIGDAIVAEKNIYLGRAGLLERGSTFSVEAISEAGVTLTRNQSRFYFSNDELQDLSLAHHYVRKPNQLIEKTATLAVVAEGYQVNKNILGELSEFAAHIRLFTPDKERAILQLDKEKLSFTIDDVVHAKPSLVYRDCAFASPVIRKDLETLCAALSKGENEIDPNTIAAVAVSYATAKLAEREAAFEHKALLREAMVYAMGFVALSDVEQAIESKASRGDLIYAKTFWISKESLALENRILLNNKAGLNTCDAIFSNQRLLTLPDTLTQGQKDAVTLAATTCDRFTSVQGLAGVGKTTMMRELQSIVNEAGYRVLGLAPMHTSKDELSANGIESMTIAHFLTHDKPYPEKTLFIVDESSMIGNQDYLALQNKITALNARALFAGDITQLQSPSSGIPHELTVKTKTQKIATMHEIMRQNPNPVLKKAVLHASNREMEASIATLSTINPEQYVVRLEGKSFPTESVITVNCRDPKTKIMDYSPIYKAIANDYLSRIPEHQKKTLVIAHAHEDRREINALIREGLQSQGKIEKDEVMTTRLASRQLSQAELLSILSYQAGDILRFDANYSVAEKGEYFTVTTVDREQKRLHCLSSNCTEFSINPAMIALKSRMSVYREEEVALAKGDTIRLRLTDQRRGHVANKEYTVEGVTNNTALLHNEEGSLELKIQQKQDAHWDYAYTTTAFGAQGQTATFVLALELAKRGKATTHRSHEIDITRPKYQATIYTEDKNALVKRFAKLEGDKTSAYQIHKAALPKQETSKANKSSNQPFTNPTKFSAVEQKINSVSAQELNLELTHQMEALAHRLLGKPNHGFPAGSNLRYGNKGSLSINLKNGLWYNFETGEKGNALQLISAQMGFNDFKDSLAYAKDFLNYRDDWVMPVKVASKENLNSKEKGSPNKAAYAKKLYEKSVSITGTLAERYLKEYRGLRHYKEADLRFIPSISTWHDNKKVQVPALLSIARDDQGNINHLQAIRLDPRTGDKDRQSKIIKQTYGAMRGCVVDLNKKLTSDTTYLAEGVETGLSILESHKDARVMALLSKSNFLNVDPNQLTEKVVLCLDNDGQKTFSDEIIKKAIQRLQDAGKMVSVVMPQKVGHDFNDVLKQEGVGVLKQQLNHPIDVNILLNNKANQGVLAVKPQEILISSEQHANQQTYFEHGKVNQLKRDQQIEQQLVVAKNSVHKIKELER